jgi:DNA-binding NarL/FixJ family response regulator
MPMPSKKRVLVVDDHPVFREGLVRVLNQEKDLQVVGEAANAPDALKAAAALGPDLAIIDISLEESNGLDLARSLRDQIPSIRILVLSMHKENLHAERALRAGANGYIMKRESGSRLLEAVRQVLAGQTYVSEPIKELLLQKVTASPEAMSQSPADLLSDREFEVFQLIGQGYGTRQIAEELHVSMKTVESHREHIRDKMQLASTFELVQRAIHWLHSEKEHT